MSKFGDGRGRYVEHGEVTFTKMEGNREGNKNNDHYNITWIACLLRTGTTLNALHKPT